MKRTRRHFIGTWPALAMLGSSKSRGAVTDDAIAKLLEPIREKHKLPALAGAIVTSSGIVAKSAVGVRKAGTDVAVTADDLWHLGSNTKAMTSTLAAIAVEAGKMRWDSTLAGVFPNAAGLKESPLATVTLTHLLSHRAGLPANLKWQTVKDREDALKQAASLKPLAAPGEKFEYSNLGYVLAGRMIERVLEDSWENLMRERVFKPLGMSHAGFGGTGTIGSIDQPWPHFANGKPTPTNGPAVDNPAVIGPAGTVHASLEDWGRFVAMHLAGENGKGRLLKTETFRHLHTPTSGGTYAPGWMVTNRPWGGGEVLTHAGSNTMNKSVAWLAPKKDFAVLVCTNQGGDATTKACDEAAAALIRAQTKA